MRFEFAWDEAEFRKLFLIVSWHGGAARSTRLLTGLMFVGIIYFGYRLAIALMFGDTAMVFGVMPWVLLVFFWVIGLFWWAPRSAARKYGRLHGGPQAIEFGTERVKGYSAVGATEIAWAAFSQAKETKDFVLLFFGDGAYYLPKRAVSDEAELEALRALLRERLGERARLMTP